MLESLPWNHFLNQPYRLAVLAKISDETVCVLGVKRVSISLTPL